MGVHTSWGVRKEEGRLDRYTPVGAVTFFCSALETRDGEWGWGEILGSWVPYTRGWMLTCDISIVNMKDDGYVYYTIQSHLDPYVHLNFLSNPLLSHNFADLIDSLTSLPGSLRRWADPIIYVDHRRWRILVDEINMIRWHDELSIHPSLVYIHIGRKIDDAPIHV